MSETKSSPGSVRESEREATYDSLLVIGFGGPEGPAEVMPFLENVTRGRRVPQERILEVASHYDQFGGVSPINGQVRALIERLRPALEHHEVPLPIYWGNRNWHPFLASALRRMAEDGRRRALGLVLSAFGSYSSCRQYLEDVERARAEIDPDGPVIDKLRLYYNHPGFIAANAQRVTEALSRIGGEPTVAFTAHSIPESMAVRCGYEEQLLESCRLTAEALGIPEERWSLVYQSRSGRPDDPWLEPDILDHIDSLHQRGVSRLVVHPIGFVSDHMEVVFDLDEEAAERCREHGIEMVRSETVGTSPEFVSMLVELVRERVRPARERRAIGRFEASPDVCRVDCCLPPGRPGRPLQRATR